MKIVIYDEASLEVLDIIEDAKDVTLTDGCLRWDTGELAELKKPFVLLPDDAEIAVGSKVSEDDLKAGGVEESPSPEDQLRAENEALKERLHILEEVTQEIIFSLYG